VVKGASVVVIDLIMISAQGRYVEQKYDDITHPLPSLEVPRTETCKTPS